MKLTTEFAELYGILIGDGCLSRYFSNYDNRWRYEIVISGYIHYEPHHDNCVREYFLSLFGKKCSRKYLKNSAGIETRCNGAPVLYYLNSFGFPLGKKTIINIPFELFRRDDLALSCVRGIFDTDGTIYYRYSKQYKNHPRKYYYKNIEIKMKSEEVIRQVYLILNRVGIQTTPVRRNKECFIVLISRQDSVKKFFEWVQPHNYYHWVRYLSA